MQLETKWRRERVKLASAYCCSYPDIELTPRDIERLGKRFEREHQADPGFTALT